MSLEVRTRECLQTVEESTDFIIHYFIPTCCECPNDYVYLCYEEQLSVLFSISLENEPKSYRKASAKEDA